MTARVQQITNNPRARQEAASAARAIRSAIVDPTTAGDRSVMHIDMSRPRRGVWLFTWANLPGLTLEAGRRLYSHILLPGWEYTPAELRTEMIEDLERFAETGELPKMATR